VAPEELGVAARRVRGGSAALDPQHRAGEVELALDGPDVVVAAGSPTAIQPLGTTAPSASAELTWTTPLMRTSAPAPMRAPGKSAAPVAMKAPSPTSTPFRCACGPTMTFAPMLTGCSARPRSSACSMTIVCSPSSTGPPSSTRTAFHSTRAPDATRTSPHSTAVGATQAPGSTVGERPSCSTSISGAR
jgi:hypothetical protein